MGYRRHAPDCYPLVNIRRIEISVIHIVVVVGFVVLVSKSWNSSKIYTTRDTTFKGNDILYEQKHKAQMDVLKTRLPVISSVNFIANDSETSIPPLLA